MSYRKTKPGREYQIAWAHFKLPPRSHARYFGSGMNDRFDTGRQTPEIPLSVRVYRQVSELRPHAQAWDELVFSLPGRLPMLSWAWVSSYLEVRRAEKEGWVCLTAFAGERLVGVLPLSVERADVWGRRVTILRQPGDRHTHSVDVVVAPGYEASVVPAFRRVLDEAVPGWFGLEFSRLDGRSPLIGGQLRVSRSTVVWAAEGYASVVRTMGDWEAYRAGLSSNFRRQLKRGRTKVAELGDVTVKIFRGAEAGLEHLERFMGIEAAGWKGREGSAIGRQQSLMEFYRVLCRRLHERRVLEWHFLSAGGKDLAGHLAIRAGQALVIHKIGYDEAYSSYSPGVLLMERVLERAFLDPQTSEVNLVTNRRWHDSWQPEKRPYHEVRVYPHRFHSLVWGAWPCQARLMLRQAGILRAVVRQFRSRREEHDEK